jgi:hypothetical protein
MTSATPALSFPRRRVGETNAVPKTTKTGEPRREELPSTLKKSPPKAQRTWAKAHDAAVEQYGEGERVPKDEKGPSDPRSTKSTAQKRRGVGETFGGVDYYGNTKDELYERAKKLGVEGRSKMSKKELARAIAQKQQ